MKLINADHPQLATQMSRQQQQDKMSKQVQSII